VTTLTSTGSWIPTPSLITTRLLELRRRRGIMIAAVLLTVGLPVLVLGIRMIFHAVDPATYGPAGSPALFQQLSDVLGEFGFIVGALIGASAGTTDLTEGVFRHLVVTGRSRVALYLARIPAGLSIVLSLVAASFLVICLVTSFAGSPESSTIRVDGYNVPANLSQAGLLSWIERHPQVAAESLGAQNLGGGGGPGFVKGPATLPSKATMTRDIGLIYSAYTLDELGNLNPASGEMAKIGLWLELEAGIGFVVALGLGSLVGQRTVTTVVMIGLEIIITPILASTVIPYFLDGQRLVVGVAMDQLKPAGLLTAGAGGGHGGILRGGGSLNLPAMPTWAMIAVIVGWIVGWTAIGAWRMATRDA
jgi:hypothetical protein